MMTDEELWSKYAAAALSGVDVVASEASAPVIARMVGRMASDMVLEHRERFPFPSVATESYVSPVITSPLKVVSAYVVTRLGGPPEYLTTVMVDGKERDVPFTLQKGECVTGPLGLVLESHIP